MRNVGNVGSNFGIPLYWLFEDIRYNQSLHRCCILRHSPKKQVNAKIFVMFLVIFQANAKTNFDETIEAHVRLAIKKERTDQVCACLSES